jgi:hypothetical protein
MISFNIKDAPGRLKYLLIVIPSFIIISASPVSGQRVREEPPPIGERLFFGGSFGLQFGTYTDIDVSPVVGLWLLPRVNIAAGPKYRFYKDPFDRTDIWGGRVYTQFMFIRDLDNMIPAGLHLGFFLHAEDELLSLQSSFWKGTAGLTGRFYVNTVLAGAGVSQPMGRRASFNIMFLWAVNESLYGLYNSPEIRVSFIF